VSDILELRAYHNARREAAWKHGRDSSADADALIRIDTYIRAAVALAEALPEWAIGGYCPSCGHFEPCGHARNCKAIAIRAAGAALKREKGE